MCEIQVICKSYALVNKSPLEDNKSCLGEKIHILCPVGNLTVNKHDRWVFT